MYTLDDDGKRVKIRRSEDISRIHKNYLKLIDDDGKCVCKRIGKDTVMKKLF